MCVPFKQDKVNPQNFDWSISEGVPWLTDTFWLKYRSQSSHTRGQQQWPCNKIPLCKGTKEKKKRRGKSQLILL